MITTGFWDWVSKKVGSASAPLNGDIWKDPEFLNAVSEYHIRELAFETAANFVANSISKCEFKTFEGGKEVKGPEYYLWNVEPNKNQNSTAFIHKWVHQLLEKNECLIVEGNGGLLVADSFTRKPYAMYPDVFSGVRVDDFTFNRTFTGDEVLYFQLNSKNIKNLTDGLYASYVKLLQYGMKAFQRSRGYRGKMKISAQASGHPDFQKTLEDMLNNRLKTFFSADNAVLPLTDGWDYDEIGSKTYSNDNTRDIRAMIDDISDFTAKGFCIPPALLRGDVSGLKDAIKMYLTFGLDPLVDNLHEEINRKRYGKSDYLKGSYLQIDTKAVEHIDLLSVSTSIDKLIASGSFCVNDIRKLVGEQPIDEPWAWAHWMTKNYAPPKELLNATSEGGEGGA